MIPIFSGEKIDTSENIIGFLVYDKIEQSYFITQDSTMIYNKSVGKELRTIFNNKVEYTTLKISFDDGKSFIKLSDLEVHTCTDFKLEYLDMRMRPRKEFQPANGSIFTVITDKGR